MHDPLVGIVEPVKPDPLLFGVFGEFIYLVARKNIVDGKMLVYRGHVMIGGGDRFFGSENLDPAFIQTGKSLRTGHLMDQMPVDI